MLELELFKKRGKKYTHTYTHAQSRIFCSYATFAPLEKFTSSPWLKLGHGSASPGPNKQTMGCVVSGRGEKAGEIQSHLWRWRGRWSIGNPLRRILFLTPCSCLGSGNPTTGFSFLLMKCCLLEAPLWEWVCVVRMGSALCVYNAGYDLIQDILPIFPGLEVTVQTDTASWWCRLLGKYKLWNST